jgi:hypothetical protein
MQHTWSNQCIREAKVDDLRYSGMHYTWSNQCIREAKVDDLRYSGMHYTWSNQCPENLIMRKLDRVLVNEKWNQLPIIGSEIFAFGYVRPFSYGGKGYWQ